MRLFRDTGDCDVVVAADCGLVLRAGFTGETHLRYLTPQTTHHRISLEGLPRVQLTRWVTGFTRR